VKSGLVKSDFVLSGFVESYFVKLGFVKSDFVESGFVKLTRLPSILNCKPFESPNRPKKGFDSKLLPPLVAAGHRNIYSAIEFCICLSLAADLVLTASAK
jgi:hypothetical protein